MDRSLPDERWAAGTGHSAAGGSNRLFLQLVLVCRYASSRCFLQAPLRERRPDWRTRSILNAPASLLEQHSPILKRAKTCKHHRPAARQKQQKRRRSDGPAARQAGRALDVLVRLQRTGAVLLRVSFNFTPPYAVEATPRDGTSLDVRYIGIRQRRSDPPRNSKPIWKSWARTSARGY